MDEKTVKQIIKSELDGKDSTPSPYAKEAWDKATNSGIVDGTRPKGYVTREQVIAIIERTNKNGGN